MTRSEEELKFPVKRATNAKSDDVTLSVSEAMRVATVAMFTLEEGNDCLLHCR
jgi:hypothetical protein